MSGPAPRIQMYPGALPPGTQVGRWRVLGPLGEGGYGAVYRAVSEDGTSGPCALKLSLRPNDARAAREAMLLRGAEHPNIIRVLDWGHWPHDKGYLFLVMEQVEGLPLHSWVEETNPSFHELVGVMGTVALTLDWLHARGVLHRDLKPEHILVRAADGQPVLIDFNAADCDGAPTLTTAVLPPATAHLLSPEAVDFHRLNYGKPGVRYTFRPTDDLYALGVCLFRALTGHYPFPPQLPPDLLALSILTDVPPMISDFNRRAPVALNPVMARLLAKAPGGRYASGRELHDSLVAAASAPGPARAWEECVFAWADAPGGMGSGARSVLKPEWPTLPASPLVHPRQVRSVEPASALARLPRPSLAPHAPLNAGEPPRPRGLHTVWAVAVGSLLVGAMVLLGLRAPSTWRPDVSLVEMPRAVALEGRLLTDGDGREVAPVGGAPEVDAGATPSWGTLTPAAAGPAAAHGKDTVDVKASSSASSSPSKRGRTAPLKKVLTAACVGMACSSAPVRPAWPPPPPPEECPEDAVLTMRKELGITVPGKASIATFLAAGGKRSFVNVREGPVSFLMQGALGKLPHETELHGRLYFSERIYGRITEARTPTGETYPVCMEVLSTSAERGLERDKPGDTPESVKLYWAVRLRQVTSFE